jgi:ketosteroid isomerase-like protein
MAEETGSVGAKPMATPAEQSTGQTPSQIAQQPESAARAETGTLVARHVAPPTSDQHGDDRTGSVPETPQSNNSNEQRSAPPFELPKPPPSVDTETVARLDAVYQSAVKANDAAIMDEILADDFVGLTDRGASLTKADLIKEAQGKRTLYEHQEVEEGTQKVRIWRDTAVVTALLRISGTRDKNPFDYKMWVSETYVRTPTGWRYVFGQPLKPDTP